MVHCLPARPRPRSHPPTCSCVPLSTAVAVGEEQSPSTRQAVDAEVQGMLKAAYNRVTRWAAGGLCKAWGVRCSACLQALQCVTSRGQIIVNRRHWQVACSAPCPASPSTAPSPTLVSCSLLKTREAELHSLAQALLQNETLTLAEIRALLNGPSSPEVPGGGSGAQRHPEGEAAGLVVGSEVVAPVPAPAAAAAAAAVPAAVPPAA